VAPIVPQPPPEASLQQASPQATSDISALYTELSGLQKQQLAVEQQILTQLQSMGMSAPQPTQPQNVQNEQADPEDD